MLNSIATVFVAAVTFSTACTIPTTPLSNTISTGFAIQVQNTSFPVIHNRFMNLWSSGGGDQHLFLSPAGDDASNLTLVDGVITRLPIRAVINGEVSLADQILEEKEKKITNSRHSIRLKTIPLKCS